MKEVIIIVGSNSIHTHRYIQGIRNSFKKIILITNSIDNTELSTIVEAHIINFKLTNIKARFQIASIIKPYPHAIVHIHQANSYAFHTLKAIKLAKVPYTTVLTAWGSDILSLPQRNILLKHMVKFNLANSDIITSDSLYMSSKIKELCPKVKNLLTINFGIQHFPESLDLNQKENIILSNRLHKPLYNIDKIILAFAKLITLDKDLNLKLIIAGSGVETGNLKNLVTKLGINTKQIIFTGHLSYPELLNWYKKAKLFVSIPNSDATSSSLLEAMAYGCYPILSNLPANLEWVTHGVNGIINQDSDNLNKDIEQALNLNSNQYVETLRNNHSLIKEKGVFENNMQKFLALYRLFTK